MKGSERLTTQGGRLAHSDQDLRLRTRKYAVRIVKLYQTLSKTGESHVLGLQLLRAGTSVGAHVAEAVRAKSSADFACKIEGAQQELEETLYWMDILSDCDIVRLGKLVLLRKESDELMAILAVLGRKARSAN